MTERTPALSRQPPAWLRRGIVYALVIVAFWRRRFARAQAQVERSGNPSTPSSPVFTAST